MNNKEIGMDIITIDYSGWKSTDTTCTCHCGCKADMTSDRMRHNAHLGDSGILCGSCCHHGDGCECCHDHGSEYCGHRHKFV